MSKLGLARGFLTRRLAVVAYENLHVFNTRQVVKVFYALSKLRFVKTRSNTDDVLDVLRENIAILGEAGCELTPNLVSRLVFALAINGDATPGPARSNVVKELVLIL